MMIPIDDGLYPDIPDEVYHSDKGSLSSSGARTLLFQSPAEFFYEREHGRPPKVEYDEGHAAHLYVLGKGAEVVVVEADSWKTVAARTARDEAYAAGKVPLLPGQDAMAREMAKVALDHPIAGALLAEGEAELSGWWTDAETGARLRLRMDFITELGGRPVVVDYKTSAKSGARAFSKSAADFGYYMQHPFYTEGLRALGIADDPAFIFITQRKTPPYRITVAQLDADSADIGHDLNRAAIRLYAECTESGHWPDYSDQIHTVSIPSYTRYQAMELLK